MEYLSFISIGPSANVLYFRPVYPQVIPPPQPSTEDTHDGGRKRDEEFRKRDEEIRDARQRLRDQLREQVFGVTRKPPPLDASPKELASIARKSDGFDYHAALAEISRLEADAAQLAQERSERAASAERENIAASRKRLRQEEEALLLLLLH